MHEYSVVRSLLKQAAEICRNHGGEFVTCVRVDAGPLSGIEPDLLQFAFNQLTSDPDCLIPEVAGAELIIEETELLAECLACNHSFAVEAFNFHCPQCGSPVRILSGDRLVLNSVSIETSDAANAHPTENL